MGKDEVISVEGCDHVPWRPFFLVDIGEMALADLAVQSSRALAIYFRPI